MTDPETPLLEARAISKSFGQTRALVGASLHRLGIVSNVGGLNPLSLVRLQTQIEKPLVSIIKELFSVGYGRIRRPNARRASQQE